MARGDLTDTQWDRLAPLLPGGKKPGRPPIWTRRQLIDGIRFRTRTGVPWRDVPERYGPWGRVYDLFRRWQRDGTWQSILAELQVQATTANATRLSALSTTSSDTGPWPRGTTSLQSDTKRPSSSKSSMSGCDQHIRYTPQCRVRHRSPRLWRRRSKSVG
ncbi:transposase [Streptomyces sp. NPDC000609]|uniref:transposase n=1 Tax=Streptomyces sp. NPDC000609 TaxID=3160957 RepID=UPI0033938643